MNRITRTTAAGVVAGALLLAGCGSESDGASDADTSTEAPTEATFTITDAWARTSPMSSENGAVYFELSASEDDALVGAEVSTDIAETTEVHETVMADAEMSDDEMSDGDDMEMSDDMSDGDDMADDAEHDDATDAEHEHDDDMEMSDDEGDDMDMGNMTMVEVDSIELPAGDTVVFEPGGYHVMLLGLVEPLEVGDTFELTLTFASGAEETVTVEVREG